MACTQVSGQATREPCESGTWCVCAVLLYIFGPRSRTSETAQVRGLNSLLHRRTFFRAALSRPAPGLLARAARAPNLAPTHLALLPYVRLYCPPRPLTAPPAVSSGFKRGYASFSEGSPVPLAPGGCSMTGLRRVCCTSGDLGGALRTCGRRPGGAPPAPPSWTSVPSKPPLPGARRYRGELSANPAPVSDGRGRGRAARDAEVGVGCAAIVHRVVAWRIV